MDSSLDEYYYKAMSAYVATFILIALAVSGGTILYAGLGDPTVLLASTECSILYVDPLVTSHVPSSTTPPPPSEVDSIKSMRLDVGIKFDTIPEEFHINIYDDADLRIGDMQAFATEDRINQLNTDLPLSTALRGIDNTPVPPLYTQKHTAGSIQINPKAGGITDLKLHDIPNTSSSIPGCPSGSSCTLTTTNYKIFENDSDLQADLSIYMTKGSLSHFGESCKAGDECNILVTVSGSQIAGQGQFESCSKSTLARGNF